MWNLREACLYSSMHCSPFPPWLILHCRKCRRFYCIRCLEKPVRTEVPCMVFLLSVTLEACTRHRSSTAEKTEMLTEETALLHDDRAYRAGGTLE